MSLSTLTRNLIKAVQRMDLAIYVWFTGLLKPKAYGGRHRAIGLSTMEGVALSRVSRVG